MEVEGEKTERVMCTIKQSEPGQKQKVKHLNRKTMRRRENDRENLVRFIVNVILGDHNQS